MSFEVLATRRVAHGVLAVVGMPEEEPDAAALGRLHADEAARARGLSPARRRTFVAGRLALRAALAGCGLADAPPLATTPRGAPTLPTGFAGSISHKRTLAVAMASAAPGDGARRHLGVDVELMTPPRGIEGRVLDDAERALVDALPEAARPEAVLARFCIKEAVYKALDRFVGRHVGFKEAHVDLGAPGPCAVTLALAANEGPFAVAAAWERHESGPLAGHLLSWVSVERVAG